MTTAGKNWSRVFLCLVGLWCAGQPGWGQPIGRDSVDRMINKLLVDAKKELFIDLENSGKLLAVADSLTRVHFQARSLQKIRLLEYQYLFFA